ncbi:MAG: glycosyltransferase [Patescibacteria group bacterium]|nr:glycosyltransferase [Patescibacteria group bacterium]
MKLLIITQKVDRNDPVLGFFYRWILEFSKRYESMVVICLERGAGEMPPNVRVLSLGKEQRSAGAGPGIWRRLGYAARFYRYMVAERKNYDSVFVHMNQEYVLLGFAFWKMAGKKIMLWRNHPAGSMLTRFAVAVSDLCFCTSRFSYTARFRKTKIMPVGIDTDFFKADASVRKKPQSILYLGRIAEIKNVHILLEALHILSDRKIPFVCDIVGGSLPKDAAYHRRLRDLVRGCGLEKAVTFREPVSNDRSVQEYNRHDVVVNLSPDGMFDKTIFEAMACQSMVLVSNRNLAGEISDMFLFRYGDAADLAARLAHLLDMPDPRREAAERELREYAVSRHSLGRLAEEIKALS